MPTDLLKWISTLQPGDIGPYAWLILLLVFLVWGQHQEWFFTGKQIKKEREDWQRERDQLQKDNGELKAALKDANVSLKKAEHDYYEQVMELTRMRVERQYEWQAPRRLLEPPS